MIRDPLPPDAARCPEAACPVWDRCARGRMPGDRRYRVWMQPGEVGPRGCGEFVLDPRLDDCGEDACKL